MHKAKLSNQYMSAAKGAPHRHREIVAQSAIARSPPESQKLYDAYKPQADDTSPESSNPLAPNEVGQCPKTDWINGKIL